MPNYEEKWYRAGAEYFGKEYNLLTNKDQYKEERYLNTALHWFRNKKKIRIFTSCIGSNEYIKKLFPLRKKLFNTIVYYYETNIDIEKLKKYFVDENIRFIRINSDPSKITKVNTLVLAGDNTIIYDSKLFGVIGKGNERIVYRNKSVKDFINLEKELKNV